MNRPRLALFTGALATLALAAGAVWTLVFPPAPPVVEALRLEPLGYADLRGWAEGGQAKALDAFRRSCARLLRLPDERSMGGGGFAGSVADWRESCEALGADAPADDAAARLWLEQRFAPYAVVGRAGREGLFTGYYEPELRGRREASTAFAVPIHGRPDDLVMVDLGAFRQALRGQRIAGRVVKGALRPYESRDKIVAGALGEKAPVLAWVDDPVGAFFLQIQGSGRIALEDGSLLRVGYAAQNGHPYYAIGKELIRRGALSRQDVSLQSIRAWLKDHPDEADAVMNTNPSYVFFRVLEGEGPIGAQGVALTPGHSLAVDRRYIPLGVPLWLEAALPARDDGGEESMIRRLVVAQDTGGAIKGVVRGDVFFGAGAEAEDLAGHMKHPGRIAVLLPRALGVPKGED